MSRIQDEPNESCLSNQLDILRRKSYSGKSRKYLTPKICSEFWKYPIFVVGLFWNLSPMGGSGTWVCIHAYWLLSESAGKKVGETFMRNSFKPDYTHM